MRESPREQCIGCGAVAPRLDEEHTLRSTLGWRLMPETLPDGTVAPVWHCPSCWAKKKVQRGSTR